MIAGHGRGFYVLEDIAPLRQMTPEVRSRDAFLFESPTAELPVDTGVTVDYYLRRRAATAALEFTRTDGRLIERRSETVAAGLHRASWVPPAGTPAAWRCASWWTGSGCRPPARRTVRSPPGATTACG